MSFVQEEFDEILDAYFSGDLKRLRESLQSSDPDSIAAAEKYLGVKLLITRGSCGTVPKREGVGQGKVKKYTVKHTSKYFDKQIKKARKAGNTEEVKKWKAFKASASAQQRTEKLARQKLKTQVSRINKIKRLTTQRESLKRAFRREGAKIPSTAYLKKYKYLGSQIKALKNSVKILSNLKSKNKKKG